MKKHAPDQTELAEAVARAQQTPALLAALEEIYREVDAELADLGQGCRACGRCCHFAAYGHRLYASTAELALLMNVPPIDQAAAAAGRCPYQSGRDCTARRNRTLGCRVFSCDKRTDESEHAIYARYHERIQKLHTTHKIPYLYADILNACAPAS